MATSRRAAALLTLLLLAGPSIAREDDVEFALALADRGYDDLAKAEIDRMPKGENSDYTRCQLLRRTALLAASNDKSPPQEVRAKFDEAKKAFDSFLKSYPASRLKAEAEFTMAKLMQDFAYYLTENLEKFEAKDRPGVQEEAGKIFDAAILYLGNIKEREHKADEGKPDTDETKFVERNKAWYYLTIAMHDRAMLKPPGDVVRIQQLTQAIETTMACLEDTDGGIFGYLASDRLGLAYWHRGQMQKGWSAEDIRSAREYFSGTISAMDVPGIEQDWPSLVNIIFKCATNFGQMCNEVGTLDGVNYPKLFHADVVKIQEKLPSIRSELSGHQLLIEDAKAMAALGLAEAAIAQLNQVSNWSEEQPVWGRASDQLAKKALNEVLATIPPDSKIRISPAVLFKAGEGSLREGNFGRAIRAFQRVLAAIDAEADPAKQKALAEQFYYTCWERINACYSQKERYLEAFYAADFPVQKFLASGQKEPSQEVADLAYYRVTALQQLLLRAPKEQKAELQERLKKAQELFTSRFQDFTESSKSVSYTVALQKMGQGKSLMQSGEMARGAALLQEAIDLFAKVDKNDPLYGIAQARIGEALVYMRKPEEAIKHLQAFIQKHQADWDNPSTPASLKQPWGWAVLWIAQAEDDLKRPAKVVELLDGFETKFKGSNLDPFFPQVRYLRITALTRSGKGDDASRECDQLMKDSPDKGYTILATLAVANDLKVRSDKAFGEGNKKAALDLKRRSLPYYDFWIARSSDISADQYTFVGSIHFEVDSFKGAADNWQKALDLFKSSDNVKMVDTLTINLAGLLVGQGRYAEALPQFEALFIPVPEVEDLRTALAAVRNRPGNVPAAIWDKKAKDIFERMAEVLAKDPDGAAKASEAKKVAGGAEPEVLVRAYADTPDLRRALARAAALTILGTDANLPPELKAGALALVKRSPELLANIARCYEELATATTENAIRAVNIYSTLIEASPNADDPENPPPGAKYSEKWFEWKYHWLKVYLTTGTAFKDKGEALLRTVCDVVKGMDNLGELKRAGQVNADLGKRLADLRDQADSALRAINKEGCK